MNISPGSEVEINETEIIDQPPKKNSKFEEKKIKLEIITGGKKSNMFSVWKIKKLLAENTPTLPVWWGIYWC